MLAWPKNQAGRLGNRSKRRPLVVRGRFAPGVVGRSWPNLTWRGADIRWDGAGGTVDVVENQRSGSRRFGSACVADQPFDRRARWQFPQLQPAIDSPDACGNERALWRVGDAAKVLRPLTINVGMFRPHDPSLQRACCIIQAD